ncbi:hypothetical protein B0E53_00679 [Micromonospora sp. MH33]|uniref:DUF3105 domain-containing protein n=1 Tax=Micromonospora sp. MH33 TaxID=1945509 RepID=UPI000D2A23AC|nr:hypothetical protein B0E53_00679 [Micromonospora sp. MH33]
MIVNHRPDLVADQLAQVRAFVTDPAAGRVVGGPVPGQTKAVKAVHTHNTAVCEAVDIEAVRQFRRD